MSAPSSIPFSQRTLFLNGDLHTFTLPEVLQLAGASNIPRMVVLRAKLPGTLPGELGGVILTRAGKVLGAETNQGHTRLDAFSLLLSLHEGVFEVYSLPPIPKATLSLGSIQDLLVASSQDPSFSSGDFLPEETNPLPQSGEYERPVTGFASPYAPNTPLPKAAILKGRKSVPTTSQPIKFGV